jgi:hypothetical protein
MNKKNVLGLAFVIMIVLSSQAYALSFGAYVNTNEIDLYRGQEGSFKLSFYSRDDGPIEFSLSAERYPEGFIISYPETFELNSGSTGNYIIIENEYVEVKTINVMVSVPQNAKSGLNEILLKAIPVNQDSQEGTLGVNAEKTFLLKVNVLGGDVPASQQTETVEKPDKEIQEEENIETEMPETEPAAESKEENLEGSEETSASGMYLIGNDRIIFWGISIAVIALLSFIIYKKGFVSKSKFISQDQN